MHRILFFLITCSETTDNKILKSCEVSNLTSLYFDNKIQNLSYDIAHTIKTYLKFFEVELFPYFKIISYFQDPFISKIIYIFVENIYNNDIVHYTIDITKKCDKIKVKKNLFSLYNNNNKIFTDNFVYNDKLILKISRILHFRIRFKETFSQLFNVCISDIIDSLKVVERTNYNLPVQLKKLNNLPLLSNPKEITGEQVSSFMDEASNFINSKDKYSRWILSKESSITELQDILEQINMWSKNFSIFHSMSSTKKHQHLRKLSHGIYQFCLNKKIYTRNFERYLSYFIKRVNDNLDRLTVFMVYTKLIGKNRGLFVRYNICNLLVWCWLYNTYSYQNLQEKNVFLELLYCISYQKTPTSIHYNYRDFSCSYISNFSEMQRIFIKRLFHFYFQDDSNRRLGFFRSITNQISWNFILCYLKLKCKLFSCQFIM